MTPRWFNKVVAPSAVFRSDSPHVPTGTNVQELCQAVDLLNASVIRHFRLSRLRPESHTHIRT